MSSSGVTAALAEFATGIRYETLPDRVVELAKHCVLDWLGVTIAGVDEPLSRVLLAVSEAEGGHPHATIIGDGRKVGVLQAALVNGAVSHALDFDDVQERLHGHPTAPVAPGLLALAERDGRSGRDVLAALVAGIEVECRTNVFMGDSHYERGWHSTATNGSFGAAAGAAHLLGFDARRCAWAMGVAGTQAAGLRAMFGTMSKALHAGKAAYNGLFAAELVQRGFTSRADILECEFGFGHTQSDGVDPAAALARLGERFEIEDVLFKYHAACHGVHATIEAIANLRRDHGFRPDEVAGVEIALNEEYLNICGIENPSTGLEGKFSLGFCAALALAGEDTARKETFSDEKVADPRLKQIARRVAVTPVRGMEMKVADVSVRLATGATHRLAYDIGVPDDDLARQWRNLTSKFRSCAVPVIGAERAEAVVAAVAGLDRAAGVHELMALCTR